MSPSPLGGGTASQDPDDEDGSDSILPADMSAFEHEPAEQETEVAAASAHSGDGDDDEDTFGFEE